MGSSPLTRGKRPSCADDRLDLGLIPAHAGKTGCPRRRSWRGRAHPRSRGENISGLFIDAAAKGSSPLTRGKRIRARGGVTIHGLIPAHAGKTPSRSPRLSLAGAHPRSRGENSVPRRTTTRTRGSSPLTRGKPVAGDRCEPGNGLIPAHAGKTFCRAQTAD